LVVVIGKATKNVSEANTLDYVLGYTAANDISSCTSQRAQSQWYFSKGFDGACPIGKALSNLEYVLLAKTLVKSAACLRELIPYPQQLGVRGLMNDRPMQECGLE
jgi:Fumarylacetoacetate (FAA) hydrolase family